MKFAVFALVGLVLIASVAYAANTTPAATTTTVTTTTTDPEANCPAVECGDYEEYKCCGSCFQESCITKKMKCQSKCTRGCFCQEGFIREFDGGKCMPKRLCPSYKKGK